MLKRLGGACAIVLSSSAMAATWTEAPKLPHESTGVAMVYDSRRHRLVLVDASASWTWEHDGRRWHDGVPAPGQLRGGAVFDSARGVLVAVGMQVTGQSNEVWEYDGVQWRQGVAAPPPLTGRVGEGLSFDSARGRTVLFGGYVVGSTAYNDTWEYDGATWVLGPPAPPALTPRSAAAMVYDSARGRSVMLSSVSSLETWEYDAAAWMPGPAPPIWSSRLGMAFDASRGRTVLLGYEYTWEYDGASWMLGIESPPQMLHREYVSLAYDSTRRVCVAFGGQYGLSFLDAWTYDGTAWMPEPPTPPPMDMDGAMAYDSDRGVAVFFGRTYLGSETLEYDGSSWTRPYSLLAPPLRTGHAMTYDSSRRRVVMFGGGTIQGSLLGDTWEFDAWGWRRSADAPPGMEPRKDHAMAFDSARARVVLFGGAGGATGNPTLNDTWEYDGTGWVAGPPAPAGLASRSGHAMAYDPAAQRIVLIGGRTWLAPGYQYLADAWIYDGSSWTAGPPTPPALSPRMNHGMAYDPTLGGIVVFGGGNSSSGLSFVDTWLFDGSSFTSIGAAPVLAHGIGRLSAYDSRRDTILALVGGYGPTHAWELGAASAPAFLTGEGLGYPNENRVRTFDAGGVATGVDFLAYAAGKWGVGVTSGNIDGGSPEILTGPGPGPPFGPQVRAFRCLGAPVARVNFFAYGTLKYGVNIGTGEADSDPFAEIVTGAGPSSVFAPHVRGWNDDGKGISAMGKVSFFAYPQSGYGVNVAAADVDADTYAEILTAPGPGPWLTRIRAFSVDSGTAIPVAGLDFDAFPTNSYGAVVAGDDVDGPPFAEIVAAQGPGSAYAARFRGFAWDGAAIAPLPGYDVTPFGTRYGGRPGAGDLDGDMRADLVVGAGPDPAADSTVKAFSYDGAALTPLSTPFVAFSGSAYGVNATVDVLE